MLLYFILNDVLDMSRVVVWLIGLNNNYYYFTVLVFVYHDTFLLRFHGIVMKCAALPLLASSYSGSHVHGHEHRGYCSMNLKRSEGFVCSVKRKFPLLSSKQNKLFNLLTWLCSTRYISWLLSHVSCNLAFLQGIRQNLTTNTWSLLKQQENNCIYSLTIGSQIFLFTAKV